MLRYNMYKQNALFLFRNDYSLSMAPDECPDTAFQKHAIDHLVVALDTYRAQTDDLWIVAFEMRRWQIVRAN